MSRARCPVCGKPVAARYRPFCSARCADVDLHRWLAGAYSIAGDDENEAETDPRDARAPDA